MEEDEDEDEQGEKFEFDDSDDMGPSEIHYNSLMKSDSTTHTTVSDLYAQTSTVQEMARQGVNGTSSTGQEGQISTSTHQCCSGECTIYTVGMNTCNWGFAYL